MIVIFIVDLTRLALRWAKGVLRLARAGREHGLSKVAGGSGDGAIGCSSRAWHPFAPEAAAPSTASIAARG